MLDQTLIVREVGHQAGLLYRPVNDRAVLFTALLRQKTLTAEDVRLIKELGYEIKVIRLTETEEEL